VVTSAPRYRVPKAKQSSAVKNSTALPVPARTQTGANVGYEAELWQMADALRDALLPQLVSGELQVQDAEGSRWLRHEGPLMEATGGRRAAWPLLETLSKNAQGVE